MDAIATNARIKIINNVKFYFFTFSKERKKFIVLNYKTYIIRVFVANITTCEI